MDNLLYNLTSDYMLKKLYVNHPFQQPGSDHVLLETDIIQYNAYPDNF